MTRKCDTKLWQENVTQNYDKKMCHKFMSRKCVTRLWQENVTQKGDKIVNLRNIFIFRL